MRKTVKTTKMELESSIQDRVREFLRLRGWKTFRLHGNAFQKGLPDLYAAHPLHGPRWIEIKRPKDYKFTQHQKRVFPELESAGEKIWILVDATMNEYMKLFEAPNWREYL